MDGEYTHPHHGMTWAVLGSFVVHVACGVAIVVLSIVNHDERKTLIQLPKGMSLLVSPSESTSEKPKGVERKINVPGAVAATPAPRPAPTPAPTPVATPRSENKIPSPANTPTATPESKKADPSVKTVKSKATPEPPKNTPKVVATPKDAKPSAGGTGTAATRNPGTAPSVPTLPDGPLAKGVADGSTLWGDPNSTITTSVELPGEYLADIVQRLQGNFHIPPNLHGKCTIQFTITPDGTLRDIKLLASSGYPGQDEKALQALRETKSVRPYAAYSKASEITASVLFNFEQN